MTMLDAIMDGLTNNENGALRELCAAAACEFLVWSQKHQPVKKLGTSSGGRLTLALPFNWMAGEELLQDMLLLGSIAQHTAVPAFVLFCFQTAMAECGRVLAVP